MLATETTERTERSGQVRPTTAPRSRESYAWESRAEDLLHLLVATPSISGDERPAVDLLVACMRELGMRAHIDGAGNAVGEVGPPPGPGISEVVLLGHIDTVPGDIRVRREGDLLFGRGAVDAKGSLATFVMAAATAELPENVRVVVIGAVEEEVASSKGARYAATRHRPDWCFIGEPSGADGLVLGYKGTLGLEARVETDGAHSAGPYPTAPEIMAAWWQRVEAFSADINRGRERIFDRLQVRLKSIESNADGLTEACTARIGFRLPTDLSPDGLEAALRRLREEDPRITLRFTGHEEAYLADRHNDVARALSVAIREGGCRPRVAVKTGTSDMNVVAPIWRCPVAAYGPGDSSLDHTPNEHISVAEYLAAIGVLRRALAVLGEIA